MTLEEIGRRLREARERKGLTLHDVQVATKIRRKYLEALERGDDAELPPEVYTRGFIRAYASLVDLDGMELARAYSEWKQRRGAGTPAAGAPAGAAGSGAGAEPATGWDEPAGWGEPDAAPAEEAGPPAPAGRRPGEGGTEIPSASAGAGAARGAGTRPGQEPPGPGPLPPAGRRAAGGNGRRPSRPEPAPWSPPPLVAPARTPRAGGRAGGGPRALGGTGRHQRRWGRWLAGLAGLAAVIALVLYLAGAPEAPPGGRPPAGTGLQGEAPGGQAPAPGPGGGGAGAPGGAGTEPQPPAEEPAAEPPAPQVTVRRDGADVYYAIRLAAPGPGGTPAPGGGGDGTTVTLEARERVWVRVRDAGGQVLLERLMQPGDREQVPLGEGLVIRAGYPRGLGVTLAGTPLEVPDEESPLNLHLEPVTGPAAP